MFKFKSKHLNLLEKLAVIKVTSKKYVFIHIIYKYFIFSSVSVLEYYRTSVPSEHPSSVFQLCKAEKNIGSRTV